MRCAVTTRGHDSKAWQNKGGKMAHTKGTSATKGGKAKGQGERDGSGDVGQGVPLLMPVNHMTVFSKGGRQARVEADKVIIKGSRVAGGVGKTSGEEGNNTCIGRCGVKVNTRVRPGSSGPCWVHSVGEKAPHTDSNRRKSARALGGITAGAVKEDGMDGTRKVRGHYRRDGNRAVQGGASADEPLSRR